MRHGPFGPGLLKEASLTLPLFWNLYVAALGLCVGSFLNVCIYRIPRKESLVSPGSHCASCGVPIRPWDNVPLVSYLLLGGRCRSCRARISPQYPLVEGLTALLLLLVYRKYGWTPLFGVYGVFTCALIVVAFIDLKHKIIPDAISLPAIPVGFLAAAWILPIGWKASLTGLLLGGGILLAVAVVSRGGMGGGDIKLLAAVGAFLGWKAVLITLLLGSLIGTLVSLPLLLSGRKGRKDMIPFGPFLAAGAYCSLLWEEEMIRFYFDVSRISVTGPSL